MVQPPTPSSFEVKQALYSAHEAPKRVAISQSTRLPARYQAAVEPIFRVSNKLPQSINPSNTEAKVVTPLTSDEWNIVPTERQQTTYPSI
jgi:hypothetical protein